MATSQMDFRLVLIDRDGSCVVTGDIADDCDASHCLPHTKGDQYITDLMTYRSSEADIVRDISDPKNGLLLWRSLRARVGSGKSAFLRE
ncbi:hypothetical protein PILCRDRAFT_828215 [Piloderma croceum F 1598]|uniref:HNH nuclease domain-containing protein n=1 Tax=Piloderma croceum (strain F 1598) TaxID=765440 RepID=A0A0C3BB09_PILCF|nr:hypothetical protein PILCRDRAFT_828215 [Piloderma croceum F 1598]